MSTQTDTMEPKTQAASSEDNGAGAAEAAPEAAARTSRGQLSDKDQDRLRKLLERGASIEDTANALGVGTGTVARYQKRLKIEMPGVETKGNEDVASKDEVDEAETPVSTPRRRRSSPNKKRKTRIKALGETDILILGQLQIEAHKQGMEIVEFVDQVRSFVEVYDRLHATD